MGLGSSGRGVVSDPSGICLPGNVGTGSLQHSEMETYKLSTTSINFKSDLN